MALTITCPACRRELNMPDEFVGRAVQCPECGAAFRVAATSPPTSGAAPAPGGEPPVIQPMPAYPRHDEPGGDPQRAQAMVSPPAYGVLTLSLFGLLCGCCTGSGFILFPPDELRAKTKEFVREVLPDPNARAEAEKAVDQIDFGREAIKEMVFFLLSLLSLAGGLSMLNRRYYGLAIAGSVVVMFNHYDKCCCVLGLPFGLWALVVLLSAEVKASFR